MSDEKYRAEAGRWLRQAEADLKAAEVSRANGCFEWAAFQSQQAGEKALKALWLFHAFDPWGHSLVTLLRDYPDTRLKATLDGMLPAAKLLDKLYIPTRYPNGLPGLTPADVFTSEDACAATVAARSILDTASSQMPSTQ